MDLHPLAYQSSAQPSFRSETSSNSTSASNLDLLVNKQLKQKT